MEPQYMWQCESGPQLPAGDPSNKQPWTHPGRPGPGVPVISCRQTGWLTYGGGGGSGGCGSGRGEGVTPAGQLSRRPPGYSGMYEYCDLQAEWGTGQMAPRSVELCTLRSRWALGLYKADGVAH